MYTRILVTVLLISLITGVNAQIPEGRKLSLALEDVPITSALDMIATQNGLNLVVAGEVSGEVTLRLENVDVATALDAILAANGYNYFVKDNVIVVKPVTSDAAGELESRVVTLKYVNPVTAEKAVASVKSARGSVTILDRGSENVPSGGKYQANRIVVTDYPALVDRLVSVIEEIDIAERSIMIEARIIETTIDARTNIGLSWPTALTARLSDDNATSAITDATDRSSAGVYDPQSGDWTWSKLSVGEVNWILNLLERDGNSRLVSDPRITTLENHEAVFKFETIIPIQTINRFTEGAATSDIVTFEDEEVGISLRVLPRINEGSTITMDVEPRVEDIIGYTGPSGNQKPITASRSISARITVDDGETVALGGLLKENEIENVQRVPLLGSWLFSSKSTEKNSTDLLILITPHILK